MRLQEIIRVPASDMDERRIREGIRTCLSVKRRVIGRIKQVVVSCGEDGNEQFYLFAENRIAAGFAILHRATIAGITGHYVTEIGLLDDYRFRGIGIAFYHLLLNQGATLFSGGTQTPDSERVWRKLLSDPSITIRMSDWTAGPDDPTMTLDPLAVDPWSQFDYRLMAHRA
ncbi:MAG: hypothetical protein ABSC06_17080 [Rhodopila sp.]|jgi:hypothetical protein